MRKGDFAKFLSVKEMSAAVGVAVLFLLASFGSDKFAPVVEHYVGDGGPQSVAIYLTTIIIVVLIPFGSNLPIIPVAVNLWGNLPAAAITWCGWMIGAAITFMLARYIGARYVERLPLLKHVHAFGALIPKQNFFWGTVALGVIGAPIDILSYAFGFLSPFPMGIYLRAIALGSVPFALFITYTATLSLLYQIYAMTIMVVVWSALYIYMKKYPPLENTHGQASNHT